MDVRHLRHVRALSITRNYARAAELLNITQPALTRSIKSLELELGVKLFDRSTRRGAMLTFAGREFVESAAMILTNFDELVASTKAGRARVSEKLSIGFTPLLAEVLLCGSMARLFVGDTPPRVSTDIQFLNQLVQSLRTGKLEHIICPTAPLANLIDIEIHPLGYCSIDFLARPGHPLMALKTVGVSELVEFRLACAFAGTSEEFTTLNDRPMFAKLGSIDLISPHYAALHKLTETTDFICLSSKQAASEFISDGKLAVLPVDQSVFPTQVEIGVAKLREQPDKESFTHLLRALSAELKAEPIDTLRSLV